MSELRGDSNLFIEPIDDKFVYITKKKHSAEIKSFKLGFDNGESVFITADKVLDYFFQIVEMVGIVDDPMFDKALVFGRGCLKIDSSYLTFILGEDCYNSFTKKPNLNSIIVEHDDNYPIHSAIPVMLLLPSEEDEGGTAGSYSEEDGIFTINWNYEKLM